MAFISVYGVLRFQRRRRIGLGFSPQWQRGKRVQTNSGHAAACCMADLQLLAHQRQPRRLLRLQQTYTAGCAQFNFYQ